MTRFTSARILATAIGPFHQYWGGSIARCVSAIFPAICLCLAFFFQPTAATIVWSGDIYPEDPTMWSSTTTSWVGGEVDTTLTVDNGSDIVSRAGRIGGASGTTAEMSVDGAGSTWTKLNNLDIGSLGIATLNITNGGAIINHGLSEIARNRFMTGGLNGEVKVDGDDFMAWQTGFGNGSTHAEGDADGNGIVDGDDFLIWQNQFGRTFGSGASAAAVPEPHSAAMLVLSFMAMCCRRSNIR